MIRPGRTPNRAASTLYVLISVGMLAVAVPRMPRLSVHMSGVFAVCWTAFALATVGANLWFALGADRERRLSAMLRVSGKRKTAASDRIHQAKRQVNG